MAEATHGTPRISAIITAYNCAEYVTDAIDSVLAQTHPVDEILVVDDGSTDCTRAVVAPYAERGVRYLYQENGGPSAVRNRGIQETSGELVAFLDCDDMWLPDKIAQQVAYLEAHPEVGLVGGHMWLWQLKDNKRWLERFGIKPGANLQHELAVRNVVGNPSIIMVRRAVLEAVGPFDRSQIWAEDWDMWLRISRHAAIGFIDAPMIVYRSHAPSLSNQKMVARLGGYLDQSRAAIREIEPGWRRAVLLARAWSRIEWSRAGHALKLGVPRRVQIWHAARALLAYPFEDTGEKAKMLVRTIIGDATYTRLRALPKAVGMRR